MGTLASKSSQSECLTFAYRIANKPSYILVALAIISQFVLAYSPASWEFLRMLFLCLAMFVVGVLASQHMKIWERVHSVPSASDADAADSSN